LAKAPFIISEVTRREGPFAAEVFGKLDRDGSGRI